VAAPTALRPPVGARLEVVETAREMRDAVLSLCPGAAALLMAAAVTDFRPARYSAQKVKKEGRATLDITLERNPDILLDIARRRLDLEGPEVVVGFAAETGDLVARAREKLLAKRLDLIVANDVSATDSGFEVDTNRVTLLGLDGSVEALPLMSKAEVAERVLDKVVEMVRET